MSVWLPPHHVPRPRLTRMLTDAPRVLVEAGAGYGKSTLAMEALDRMGRAFAVAELGERDLDAALLMSRLERALSRGGLSDLAGSLASVRSDPESGVDAFVDHLARAPAPLIVVFDDIHHGVGSAGVVIARLARALDPPHALWLLGRTLPTSAASVRDIPGLVVLDAADLAFNDQETGELCTAVLDTKGPAPALCRTTGGWASAIVLGAFAAARSELSAHELRGDATATLAQLVRRSLDSLDQADRRAIVAAARLPLLSAAVVDRATAAPGLLDRASLAGLPLTRNANGWWGFPGPVVDLLAGMGTPDPDVARRAAAALVDAGEPGAAIEALLGAGLDEEAARLLSELPAEALERLGDSEVNAAASRISDEALHASPRALLHLARACENDSQIVRRGDALDRAERASTTLGDEVLQREVQAERARDLVRDGKAEEAQALARALMEQAGPGELATKARAALVLGTAMVRHGTTTGDAEPILEQAHRLSLAAGRREWAVHAWSLLAYMVDFVLGRNETALRRFDEALTLLPARSGQRAVMLTARAEVLNAIGRYDEATATLQEARRLARDLGLRRAHAYAAWESARTSSQLGDPEETLRFVEEAEEHRGEWFATDTGVVFLADAADLLDRAGATEAGGEYLRRALERQGESPFLVLLSAGVIAARRGDPSHAEAVLNEALRHPWCLPRERWRIALMRAHAARRRGDPAAATLAAAAMREAAAIGHPEAPLIRERVIAEGLIDLADEGGGDPPDPAMLPVRICALGTFTVTRGSETISLPPGRPERLVKLLAACGGSAHAEEIIEALWPDVEPASGRKRLRNALSRLRVQAGDVVVRDGESLALAATVEVDVSRFDRDAQRALAATVPQERAAIARLAISRYAGDLLPAERYDDWAASSRERLRGRYLALLELLATQAHADGDIDEAIRLVQRATEADPLDDHRLVQLAGLLLAQGRRAAAKAAVAQADAILSDLGIDPAGHHREIRASLRG